MAPPAGIEPVTHCLEGKRNQVQLPAPEFTAVRDRTRSFVA